MPMRPGTGQPLSKRRRERRVVAGAAVEHAQAVRPQYPHPVAARGLHHAVLHGLALGIDLGEAGGEHQRRLGAAPAEVVHRLQRDPGRHRDDRDIRRFRQIRDRGIGAQSLHLRPVRVHRIERALKAGCQHVGDRPAADAGGIVGGTEHRDGARGEQRRQAGKAHMSVPSCLVAVIVAGGSTRRNLDKIRASGQARPMTLAAILRHLAFAGGLACLSALIVRLMIAARVMDHPDARKSHDRPIPKGGGVGIVVAFVVGLLVLYWFAEFARLAKPYFLGVIAASLAIAVVAFLDDMADWPFTVKLAAQLLAALVAVATGIYVQDYRLPYVGPLYIGWLGGPATLAWMLFVTNAMNFIDGLNGLAGGVALIAACFLAAIAAAHGGWFAYFAALLLAAGLARLPAVQLPARPHLHGRRRQPVLRFHARHAGRGRQPLRRGGAIAAADADAAGGGAVRCGLHPRPSRLGGRAADPPHRGHLYQIAQRSGVPAPAIALVHWGFALFGGRVLPAVPRRAHRAQALRPGARAAAASAVAGVRHRPLARAPDLRGGSGPPRHRFRFVRGPLSAVLAASPMIERRSRRNAAPFNVRCTSTLRRSSGSTLRRARSSSPSRSSARVIAGLETCSSAARPRTVCAAVLQVAGQEDAELAGRQIGAVAAHQCDDRSRRMPTR